ncbi:MAG: hypothetical protein WBB07_07005 [Mycobacterium sp.]
MAKAWSATNPGQLLLSGSAVAAGIAGIAVAGWTAAAIATMSESVPPPIDLRLVSDETSLRNSVGDQLWYLRHEGSRTSSGIAYTGSAVIPGPVLPPTFGPGGWLIGDGLDVLEIDPTCTVDCRGVNAGLLFGNGRAGAFGGVWRPSRIGLR